MYISRIIIKNYKKFEYLDVALNEDINVFVGDNDSGKTTILEAIAMTLTGKINGSQIMSKITADWFNLEIRNKYKKSIDDGKPIAPPNIEIELYFNGLSDDDTKFKHYKGSNNSLTDNCYGVKIDISFNKEYSKTYMELLETKKLMDIPIELYKVEYKTFAQPEFYIHNTAKKVILIDTTKKDYGNVLNKFVSNSLSMYLTEDDETNLSVAYRSNRAGFVQSDEMVKLNQKIRENQQIKGINLSLNLREGEMDDWKSEMTLSVNGVPFENNGFGTQNMIKSEMIANDNTDVDFIILEEPENNLSFTNMSSLISKLSKLTGKQLFISTHSSFVANKLSLKKLQLLSNGIIKSFNELNKDTFNYFMKLPGYNTLRLLLANKIILVEGPADELIVQRAYLDHYDKLPIEDGIDVLSVGGLAFARYCELASLIDKQIVVLTDNDHNYENVINKYEEYSKVLTLCVEKDNSLHTLEPSVLNANKDAFDKFKNIIYKGNDSNLDFDSLLSFMTNNKSEWAMRVFQSEERIVYPHCILKAIGVEKDE